MLVYTSDGFLPQDLLFRFTIPECAANIKYSSLVRVTLSVLAVLTCDIFLCHSFRFSVMKTTDIFAIQILNIAVAVLT